MKPSCRPFPWLLVAVALLPVLFLSGCASCRVTTPAPASSLRTLQAGESVVVKVNSRHKLHASGLMLVAGGTYRFTSDPKDEWVDLWRSINADGYDSWLFRPVAHKKRVPTARWFELIAKIGEGDDFRVNLKWDQTVPAGGELFFYSNDLCRMYWNNFGSISVTVTRVE